MSDHSLFIRKIESIGCEYITDEPMSRHCTFRIGGNCDIALLPDTENKLIDAVCACREFEFEYMIVGNGSDVVFGSGGYKGVIIFTNKLAGISVSGNHIKCGAGVNMSALCLTACENSLSGAERLFGIPGTVGGAVVMNAGAYNCQISDVLVSCDYFDGEKIVSAETADLDLSYRHSIFSDNDYVILSAKFEFTPGDKSDIKSSMNEYMNRRREKQPLEYPSAGSTFLRPKGYFAGALIEQCGLKGCTVGGAQVSSKHAGFVINTGSATSNDVKKLVSHIQQTVKSETGVSLKCEIIFAGEDL